MQNKHLRKVKCKSTTNLNFHCFPTHNRRKAFPSSKVANHHNQVSSVWNHNAEVHMTNIWKKIFQYTFAATSPRFPEIAKWFCITLKEGSLSPLATACPDKSMAWFMRKSVYCRIIQKCNKAELVQFPCLVMKHTSPFQPGLHFTVEIERG